MLREPVGLGVGCLASPWELRELCPADMGGHCVASGARNTETQEKGACQQVPHPSVPGPWLAGPTFLALGSEVGKASWRRRAV